MNCREFERDLVRLSGGEVAETEREGLIECLRVHSQLCTECGASTDLLELLSLPAGERGLVELPPDGYWDEFDERLRSRLQAERGVRSRGGLAWIAAAAILLVTLSLWWLGDSGRENGEWQAADSDSGLLSDLPAPLAASLVQSSFAEAAWELDAVAGWDGPWTGTLDEELIDSARDDMPAITDGILPSLPALDPDAGRELLEWFREENSKMKGVTS